MLNDFPDSKDLFEYEDYVKNATVKNGSAFIYEIIDRNMDRLTNRENYVGYLANRPGYVKFNSHGRRSAFDMLFSSIPPISEVIFRTDLHWI